MLAARQQESKVNSNPSQLGRTLCFFPENRYSGALVGEKAEAAGDEK